MVLCGMVNFDPPILWESRILFVKDAWVSSASGRRTGREDVQGIFRLVGGQRWPGGGVMPQIIDTALTTTTGPPARAALP